jgi:hypothetical protein
MLQTNADSCFLSFRTTTVGPSSRRLWQAASANPLLVYETIANSAA